MELIKSGVNESYVASEKLLAKIRTSSEKGHDDMRVTTEEEGKAQRAHNLEVETKLGELVKSIAAQFLSLRADLETTAKNTIEVCDLVSGLQEQKKNMIDEVEKHFTECQEKTEEMRTLIGQSEAVLQETRSIVDGAIKALNARFERHDMPFAQIR